MKRVLIIAALITSSIVFAQKKELTLEDAVLKQRTDLAPKNLKSTKWIPGTESFSYQSDDMKMLFKQTITSSKEVKITTLEKINNSISAEKGLSHFYGIKWVDKDNFIFNVGVDYYNYSISTNKSKLFASLNENAVNVDLDLATKNIAYTQGKALIINISNDNKMVTQRDHEEIVVGQAIARYEFGISKGTFWSPKGVNLAFYEKDEIEVANYPLLDITTTPANLNNIKYPMAGQKSEIAKVGVYNTQSKKIIYLKTEKAKDDYLTNLSWSLDGKYILIAEVNRGQNHMKLNKYDAQTGKLVKTLFEEKNDKWVEPETPAYFINKNEFIWLSERDGFMNIYKYNLEGKLIKQLTSNKWVTKSIINLDASKKKLIVSATGVSPLDAHTFSVDLKSGKQTKITKTSGVHTTKLSSNGKYLLDNYTSLTIPRKIEVIDLKGKVKRNVLTAENPIADYKMSTPEIATIKSADGKTDLYTRMIKPSNFNPNRKYPVLVYVYGGPHAQMITNRWGAGASGWMYYFAEKGYIIYTVDNRGSKSRGFEFESIVHRNLGDAEMADQLKGVAYLKSLPYVNKNRIAVHGWSFGGFMTTSLMLRNAGVFNVGVAGGPVTDWKYYEVMYGERYMDMPEENKEGYKKAKLHNYVKNLEGKLLLIHGTVDDVVVPQHSYTLLQSFVKAGVQVDFFPYSMHPHNVRGKDRVHLMRKILNYVEDNNRMKRGMRGGNKNQLTPKEKEELSKLSKEERIKRRGEMMKQKRSQMIKKSSKNIKKGQLK